MPDGTIRYTLQQPFQGAIEAAARSLKIRGLRLAGEMDISRRLEQALGIVLPPCRILFVLPDLATLRAGNVHPWAATFLPQHVVVSSREARTDIHVQNRIQADSLERAPQLYYPVAETQKQILDAIEAIGIRPSIVL